MDQMKRTLFVCVAVYALAACLLLLSSSVKPVHAGAKKEEVQHGEELFKEKGCTHCHGEFGQGKDDAPDLTNVRKRMKAEQVEKQIHDGGQVMPAFGDSLTADETHALVEFLRSKRKVPKH